MQTKQTPQRSSAPGSSGHARAWDTQNPALMSDGAAAAAPSDISLIKQPSWTDAGFGTHPDPVFGEVAPPGALAQLARQYLRQEVFGIQARGTFTGKAHDLGVFVRWFGAVNELGSGATPWLKQDTVDFLKELERRGRAPATINRTLATLKAFAAWLCTCLGNALLPCGHPTLGVSGLNLDPLTCRKLADVNMGTCYARANACDRLMQNQPSAISAQHRQRRRPPFSLPRKGARCPLHPRHHKYRQHGDCSYSKRRTRDRSKPRQGQAGQLIIAPCVTVSQRDRVTLRCCGQLVGRASAVAKIRACS